MRVIRIFNSLASGKYDWNIKHVIVDLGYNYQIT